MDAFWAQVLASLVGALAGGVISAVVAWRVFASERRARAEDQRLSTESARRERDRAALAKALGMSVELTEALPTTADGNAFIFAVQKFGLAAGVLSLDMTESDKVGFDGWLNAFVQRYAMAAENVRRGQGSTEATGDLIMFMQIRLERWFRGESPSADFGLSDADYRLKYPDAQTTFAHPDNPSTD